jgi:hypothetical protein
MVFTNESTFGQKRSHSNPVLCYPFGLLRSLLLGSNINPSLNLKAWLGVKMGRPPFCIFYFLTPIYTFFDAEEQKKYNQIKPEIPAIKEARSMPVFASSRSSGW